MNNPRDNYNPASPAASESEESSRSWKGEVVSRIAAHKARRRRRIDPEGAMELEFDHPASPDAESGNEVAAPSEMSEADARSERSDHQSRDLRRAAGLDEAEPVRRRSVADIHAKTDAKTDTKIIEFPRPRMARESGQGEEQLKIFEVAAGLGPQVAVPKIHIESADLDDTRVGVEIAPPVQTAPLSQRILSGLLDIFVVACGALLFFAVIWVVQVPLPTLSKFASLSRAVVVALSFLLTTAILWPFYQAAFLIACGSTPGMRIAGLELLTFEGHALPARFWKWRAAAMLLSFLSCGMGFAWAMIDEDRLGWHDRITRSHLGHRRHPSSVHHRNS